MKDNMKEYAVTLYVTVAITAHGVKAASAANAAMDLALSFDDDDADREGYVAALLRNPLCLPVNGTHCELNAEVMDGVDGFLVATADGTAARLDKNGNPARPEPEEGV